MDDFEKEAIGRDADAEDFRYVPDGVLIPRDQLDLKSINVRSNLYCTVLSVYGNEELIKSMPHRIKEGIALVPRLMVDFEKRGSVWVTNSMLPDLRMTSEEVLEHAFRNACKSRFDYIPIEAAINSLGGAGMSDTDRDEAAVVYECGLTVLTCDSRSDGAVALFVPSCMEEAQRIAGDDCLLLPSSRHELLILPNPHDNKTIDELEDMVYKINRTVVDPKDRLSDRVLQASGKTFKVAKAAAKMAAAVAAHELRDVEQELKSAARGR